MKICYNYYDKKDSKMDFLSVTRAQRLFGSALFGIFGAENGKVIAYGANVKSCKRLTDV